MKFTPLFAIFMLLGTSLYAQHPWMRPLASAADDMVFTLRVSDQDSVCVLVNRAQGEVQLADGVVDALREAWVYTLRERIPVKQVKHDCSTGSVNLEVNVNRADEERLRIFTEANHLQNDNTWSAVFFIEDPAELPLLTDGEDPFNKSYFELPELPAEARVLHMSGAVLSGSLVSADGVDVVIEVPRKRRKPKTVALHKSEIFSVTFDSGEWVLYAPDALLGDDLTVDEMRIYIAGEQDARNRYNPRPTTAVGVVFAAGAAVLASGGLILTLLPPIAYGAAQFIPVIRIREHTISNPEHRYNIIYAEGYGRVARSRKVIGGFKGGAVGMVIGIAGYFLLAQ
jgi:hypothetical protein